MFRYPLCSLALLALASLAPASEGQGTPAQPNINDYIANGWDTLSRSMSDCNSVVDPKVTTPPVMYLPAGYATPTAVAALATTCNVQVRHLPRAIHQLGDVRPSELPVEGLLYLPNKYVVPGGRFNEMYGWDSYFILLGLIHDNRQDLARGMVENFFFEIRNYGAVLNANRTYFFTRSQPPFLTSMIREVYEHAPKSSPLDTSWLAHAYALAERDYSLWTARSPTRPATPASPAITTSAKAPSPRWPTTPPTIPTSSAGCSPTPINTVEYLVTQPNHPTAAEARGLARETCDIALSKVCALAVVDGHRLSSAFYRGDRAMRESGFDTSFRFGPFSGSTEDFAPVCLNALLFRYEEDMAHFAGILGKSADQQQWQHRAEARHAAIDKYLWDDAAGLYRDYDFAEGKPSPYRYLTTFYPLWAGLASPAQAAAVEKQLPLFEQPGGLQMSDTVSGVQWDAPFGWAPVQWLAIDGLNRNGFHADALRIARKFSTTVEENFTRDHTIREKYNVANGSDNVKVAAGYKSNVVGFGWTNGVYRKLQDLLATPPTR